MVPLQTYVYLRASLIKKIIRKMREVEIIAILITLVITNVISIIFIFKRHLRGVPSSM